jgi:hypothetical protein
MRFPATFVNRGLAVVEVFGGGERKWLMIALVRLVLVALFSYIRRAVDQQPTFGFATDGVTRLQAQFHCGTPTPGGGAEHANDQAKVVNTM